jgi:hypothetical protein
MNTSMNQLFADMAKQELEEALSVVPSDPIQKFVLFAELVRVIDYWSFYQPLLPKENRISIQDFELIVWGWNLAIEHIYVPVSMPGAFPIMESTNESRTFAINLLYKFGKSVLLYRASEMMRFGFLMVEEKDHIFHVKVANKAKDNFLDNLEFSQLDELEMDLINQSESSSNGWQLFNIVDYSKIEKAPGSFISRPSKNPLKDFKTEDIDGLMAPLIHKWDTGRGIMMGCGARPEIDDHFLAEATEKITEWRAEAGFHPNANLNGVSGADITIAITFIVFLHMKHKEFALIALQTQSEISIPQSLTIWEPLDQLEKALADYSGMDISTARKALEMITMHPNEASYLHGVTKNFFPLLISLGNGLVLRPIASLIKNPFISTIALQGWRNSRSIDQLSMHREEWMRSEIYSMFQGTRYRRINGNIKIRSENKIVTDIDAAIFDILTGELALFQIKWQDYFTNDIRELRSKASNLTKELDDWADKVTLWIQRNGNKELVKSLRLKLGEKMVVSSVYLFGISRTYARMQGFGFTTTNEKLAIANLPQLRRVRYEIGPTKRVFNDLFDVLKQKMGEAVRTSKPLPLTITASDKKICFEDLWNKYGNEEE